MDLSSSNKGSLFSVVHVNSPSTHKHARRNAPTHSKSMAVATLPRESVACTWLAIGLMPAPLSVRSTVMAHGSTLFGSLPVDMYLSMAVSMALPCFAPYPMHPLLSV